ncbi:NAD(P)-binding protein [Halobacillus naozhouensis]|uniref:precorrin-2 dehydrogenase n=1 Tax=Halobacillus naozhouensis TaxID=554880 RepID=A0ABY8IVR4_9BACI|nr:NAD(P)-binding protein [Halobacillus naozhouensis]WFT73414.1 NAD(P)-binding protein [Halobacillus naozhouensis]
MLFIPTMLNLEGKKVVVVGGGNVAKRKIDSLLMSKAQLTVVSPSLTDELISYYETGSIDWKQKNFAPADIDEAFLIIAATNSESVNNAVIKAAPGDRLLNAASNVQNGNVSFPAYFTRGKLTIAISTAGASPLFAKKVKQELSCQYNERYEQYLDFLFDVRHLLKKINLSSEEKNNYLHEVLSNTYLDSKKQKDMLHYLKHYRRHLK